MSPGERTGVAKDLVCLDARNRLKDTYFGDGSPASIPSTTPMACMDGGLEWAHVDHAYNGRGLLESETLTSAPTTFSIGHAYTANGHAASLPYPVGRTVDYLPNGSASRRRSVPTQRVWAVQPCAPVP